MIWYKEKKALDKEDIKKLILENYYRGTTVSIEENMSRELIVSVLKDNYSRISTILCSVCGSPPKGRAILVNDYYGQRWDIYIFNGSKFIKNISSGIGFFLDRVSFGIDDDGKPLDTTGHSNNEKGLK